MIKMINIYCIIDKKQINFLQAKCYKIQKTSELNRITVNNGKLANT